MKWLLGGLFLLLAGALLRLGLLVYAMYVLIGLVVVGVALSRHWAAAIRVDRNTLPPAQLRGESVVVRITMQQDGRLGVPWLIAEDLVALTDLTSVPPRLKAEGGRMRLVSLARGEEEAVEYSIDFLERGYYQIGPVLIETGDVFGLSRRHRVAGAPQFVAVLPDVVAIEEYDLASMRPVGDVRLTHRLFEDPTRVNGVRPYQIGDGLNRIHWRASARVGTLQCRTFEASCVAGAMVLLDFHEHSYTGPGRWHRQELAVVAVASLTLAVAEAGEPAGFATNARDAADRVRAEGWSLEFDTRGEARERSAMHASSDRLRPLILPPSRDLARVHGIRELLARVEPGDGLNFGEFVAEIAPHLPREVTVVAVVGDVTAETALALGQLRRRGFAVTALVIVFDEPDVSDWAQPQQWVAHLLSEGVAFRRVNSRESLARLGGRPIAGRA